MYICNYDFTFIYLFLIMIVKKMQFKLLPRLNNVVLHDFYCCCRQANDNWNPQITIKKIILTICLPVKVGYKKKKQTYIILKFTRQPDGQSDMVWCYSG